MPMSSIDRLPARQRGAALIVGLVLLLVMTVLGVASMRGTTLQERMAGNLRDANLAFQAAEAALRDAEEFLDDDPVPVFAGVGGLLYPPEEQAGQVDYWNDYDWSGNSRDAAALQGVAAAPQYVIEELPSVPCEGCSLRGGPSNNVSVYRITARAVGGTDDAVSILQSIHLKNE